MKHFLGPRFRGQGARTPPRPGGGRGKRFRFTAKDPGDGFFVCIGGKNAQVRNIFAPKIDFLAEDCISRSKSELELPKLQKLIFELH